MTNATEAKLAREAEICYTTLALATDYDCWHAAEADVTVEQVLKVLHDNIQMAQRVIRTAVASLVSERTCGCVDAMRNAIVTSPERIPQKIKTDLAPIIGKYLKQLF
jgi:5'-methylthioadenosine phosphorylase